MTFAEALKQHYVAGFVLRRRRQAADGFYLADYRTAITQHTTREEDAEFFLRLIDANEMALRLRHVTGYAYDVETVGTTVPGPAPRCCGAEAEPCKPCKAHVHTRDCYDNSEPGREAQLICNDGEYHWPEDEAVGRERVRLSDGRKLDVTVDELAAQNAMADAARSFRLPLDAPKHVFVFDNEVS